MNPYYVDESVTLHHGNCLDVLRSDELGYDYRLGYAPPAFADASVDAVVTDPPYGLEFMGREWDSFKPASARLRTRVDGRTNPSEGKSTTTTPEAYVAGVPFQRWCEAWSVECLRVLKPGGYMLAFGGSRTWHRLAAAVEDAGFEIRDSIAWLYGSGFPKSLDVSKAIDKAAGAERQVVGQRTDGRYAYEFSAAASRSGGIMGAEAIQESRGQITAPATDAAHQWQGWGTALKPAFEPIVVARKPLIGTVAANVMEHGTGALNIDGCRVEAEAGANFIRPATATGLHEGWKRPWQETKEGVAKQEATKAVAAEKAATLGRWPTNVVLDESQAAELDKQTGVSRTNRPSSRGAGGQHGTYSAIGAQTSLPYYADEGGASRFFPVFRYEAKAPTKERPSYVKAGAGNGRVTGLGGKVRQCNVCETRAIESGASEPSCGHGDFRWEKPTTDSESRVAHATVKPLDLMRWLVRLVTPPGGTVLEPFAGSGTTAEACVIERFQCIAIEREDDYLPLIVNRLTKPIQLTFDMGEEIA